MKKNAWIVNRAWQLSKLTFFTLFIFFIGLVIYVLTALISAIFPIQGRIQHVQLTEPPVYVCADDVHSDYVLPLHDPLVDWEKVLGGVASPNLPGDAYISIGWGDLVFFTEILNWSDMTLSQIVSALVGANDTVIRVIAMNEPKNQTLCHKLSIDGVGRVKLIKYILSTLYTSEQGSAAGVVVDGRYIAYYKAKGKYGPSNTCNQWTSWASAAAGLPYAWFSPFSFDVIWPIK